MSKTKLPCKKGPHPFDIHFGSQIRLRRIQLGMSQMRLGALIGVTFQQVQKDEKGINRVCMSKAFGYAEALDTTIEELIAGYDPKIIRLRRKGARTAGLGRADLEMVKKLSRLSPAGHRKMRQFVGILLTEEDAAPRRRAA